MIKTIRFNVFYLLLALGVLSCATPKDILLFQDIEDLATYNEGQRNDPTIQEDDMLIITVSAADMEAVRPYNLMIETRPIYNQTLNLSINSQQQTYMIDIERTINFQILGKLHVAEKTRSK